MNSEYINFAPKFDLHPKFWKNKRINSVFAAKLREIAQDLIEDLDISKYLKDIVITGSIASYNWHDLSDIDLHLILDFEKIDSNTDLVKDFFFQKRMNWNKSHNIFIAGHEIEVYFQDIKEDHKSAGLYSLVQSKWIQEPSKSVEKYDECAVKCKAEALSKEIDLLSYLFFKKEYEESYSLGKRIKEKIKKLRNSGLDKSGVFSVENLAFKTLRNTGELQKLSSLVVKSYDKMHSLEKLDNFNLKVN